MKESLLGTADIARMIGVDRSTITRWAARHGIGQLIGCARVFSRSDAQKIRKACMFRSGNPGRKRIKGKIKTVQKPRKKHDSEQIAK